MKTIGLIHTVKPVLNQFSTLLRNAIDDELTIYEIYDDFLAIDPANIGYFSKNNKQRLYNDISNCSLASVDIIIVTCSTLTPIVEEIRPFFDFPIIAIDDAMCETAVKNGSKIRVIATAKSTIKPTVDKLNFEAKKIGKNIEIVSSDDIAAYDAMKSGNLQKHDKLLTEILKSTKGFDVIVLAQASMAHLATIGSEVSNILTLGSTNSCIEYVVKLLKDS